MRMVKNESVASGGAAAYGSRGIRCDRPAEYGMRRRSSLRPRGRRTGSSSRRRPTFLFIPLFASFRKRVASAKAVGLCAVQQYSLKGSNVLVTNVT